MMPGPVTTAWDPVKNPHGWEKLTQEEKVDVCAAKLGVTVPPELRKCFIEDANCVNAAARTVRLNAIGAVHAGIAEKPALILQLAGTNLFILWNP